MKAHVTRATKDVPPRTHNLVRLAEVAIIHISEDQRQFMREFDEYQLEGRYPIEPPAQIDSESAGADFYNAEELLEWLKKQS